MRAQLRFGAVTAAIVVACKFSPNPATTSIDAPPVPDAGMCVGTTAECAGPDTLRTCAGAGMDAIDTACTWRCLGSSAHCGKLVPTGGAVVPEDLDPDPLLGDVMLVGTIDG